MKVKDLVADLKTLPQDKEIYVACDEELNTVFLKFQIGDCGTYFCFYGLSGTEMEDSDR